MNERRLTHWLPVVLAALLIADASGALGQTNSAKALAVGTWELDLQRSDFGTDPKPQSLTLTILSDTTAQLSWRVDVVDDHQNRFSYSWSGPKDGSMHPMKAANGQEIGQQSAREQEGALLRHAELSDGGSFDSRATMSDDGNTITDAISVTAKDGTTMKAIYVAHRAGAAK